MIFERGEVITVPMLLVRLHATDGNPIPSPHEIAHDILLLMPALFSSAVVLVVTYLISRILSGRLQGTLQHGGFAVNTAILLARGLWVGLWALGVLLILKFFGFGLSPLAAFVGVVGLAASLSLQQVLQNVVAGVYLLAEHPFRIGDLIAVVGPAGVNHEGTVEDIQVRTTRLRNRDQELIMVPNSSIFAGVVTNRTVVGGFARHVTITVPRDVADDQTQRRIIDVVAGVPAVLADPRPRLWVDRIGKEDWTASLSVWSRSQDATSDVVWALGEAFPEATVSDGTLPV